MKQTLLMIFLITISMLIFTSCKKDNDGSIKNQVVGKWINTQVDGSDILTDDVFVMELTDDNVQTFGNSYVIVDDSSFWAVSNKYSYKVDGKTIIVDGYNAINASTHLEMIVNDITQSTMTYTVKLLVIGNDTIIDNHIYQVKRSDVDYSNAIIGTWYGKNSDDSDDISNYHYWKYNSDGSYNYYYYNSFDSTWKCKTNNDGEYYIFGDILASNFSNNMQTGKIGRCYECWNVSISGDSMTWNGLHSNGKTKFNLIRKDNPPTTK